MPRPGPRPYECIRRAWHSEAHQPLRGKLTQEILTVVTELHKPDTRRKREWQEKLPIVVLRAEEILYSKAKSEAEYMDVKTLRERLEDAVDTMIRRTDLSKEGPYMEPCVEAALSLGCVPKSFPRGQRAGARQICANVKRAWPSSSTVSSPNPAAVPAPLAKDYCSQDRDNSVGAVINPAFLRLPRCTVGGFSAPSIHEHFSDRAYFQGGAATGQDFHAMVTMPRSSDRDLFTRCPFLGVSSSPSSLQSTVPLASTLHSNSPYGSLSFQPIVNPEAAPRPFMGSQHFPSTALADLMRYIAAPVAVPLEDGGSSPCHVKQFAEVEDLQLRLAPPGSYTCFTSSSPEFSNSGSCITAQQPEEMNRSISSFSDTDHYGDTHLYTAFPPDSLSSTPKQEHELQRNYANAGTVSSDSKRKRLCDPPSLHPITDRELSEECCALQIGLQLKV